MDIVIDTNILIAALKTKDDKSPCVKLIEDVSKGKHTVYLSPEIIKEYAKIAHRESLNIDPITAEMYIGIIIRHSVIIEPKPTRPDQVQLRDEKDRVFFDVAKCENARLITFNIKDYPVHELITLIHELYPKEE